MNPDDINFMKTGYETIESKPQLDIDETSKVLAIMTIFMERAISISEQYVVYQKRKIITDKDIIKALKCQAMDYNHIWDEEEVKNNLHSIYDDIHTDLTSGESSDIDESLKEENTDNIEVNKKDLKIDMELIVKLSTVDERWKYWNPTEEELILLKKAIDNTEQKFNNQLEL